MCDNCEKLNKIAERQDSRDKAKERQWIDDTTSGPAHTAELISTFKDAFGTRPGYTEDFDKWTEIMIIIGSNIINDGIKHAVAVVNNDEDKDRRTRQFSANLANMVLLMYSLADVALIDLDRAINETHQEVVDETYRNLLKATLNDLGFNVPETKITTN